MSNGIVIRLLNALPLWAGLSLAADEPLWLACVCAEHGCSYVFHDESHAPGVYRTVCVYPGEGGALDACRLKQKPNTTKTQVILCSPSCVFVVFVFCFNHLLDTYLVSLSCYVLFHLMFRFGLLAAFYCDAASIYAM